MIQENEIQNFQSEMMKVRNEQPRRKRTGYRNGLAGGTLVHSARFQDFAPRGGELDPREIKSNLRV
jgi:hypothetical protein